MAYLLGVDIGTSGTKTVLFRENGQAVASATVEYPLYQPKVGWAEQDPDDWYRATVDTIAQVVAQSGVSPRDIVCMGLSGQMHGSVLLDKSGKVLRRALLWCDQRTEEEAAQVNDIVGLERMMAITCNPALTSFTATKVQWVKNHEPEIYEKIAKVLLPKDYVRYRLTGVFASEVSDASGTSWLDVPNRCWSREILSKLDVPYEWMPDMYESYEISGRLTAEAAEKTGLWAGMPVAGGGGDQASGAVGNGIVKSGVISSTIGTSGVVFACTDRLAMDPRGRTQTFCHAVPGSWHVMGVTQAAGLSLRWMRDEFCVIDSVMARRMDKDPYELMGEEAGRAAAGCQGLLFLPYLMGERAPYLDPKAKGVFFGLSGAHNRGDMIRAVMEGVGYSLRDCLGIIRELGVPVEEIRVSGGGARSPLWRQIQADMFHMPVHTTNSSEGPALGVALLAGVGAGLYASVPEACDAAVSCVASQGPDAGNSRVYDAAYPIYQGLYPALKPSFDAVARTLEG